jgi:transcriptional regulator with XRE-family HTH domain
MAEKKKLAERIKMYREQLELTVEALAEKTGVKAETIRAVESGEAYPALGILVRLSRGLGQRLGTFMDDQYAPDPVIVRASERTAEKTTRNAAVSAGFAYFPLGRGKTDRHMEPFYIEIAADAPAPFSSHEGEEFIIVVSGEVELVYGHDTFTLKPGDSMYYNSVVQHKVSAANGKPATIYAVIFMPF